MSWQQVSSELGLGLDTVRRWCRGVSRPRALVPITVIAERRPERIVSVASPAGFRIEGLSLGEATELLRVLG